MRSYWGDQKGLEADVAQKQRTRHRYGGGKASFTVKVTGGLEVVEGRFESKLVVCAGDNQYHQLKRETNTAYSS